MKVSGKYYPNLKQSIVTIKDKHGIYTGVAYLHPDDTPNEIVGCNIAAQRAAKAKLRKRRDNLYIKIKTLKSFKKEVTNYCPLECENSMIIDRLNITIAAYQKELSDVLISIAEIKQEEKEGRKLREKIKAKMSK